MFKLIIARVEKVVKRKIKGKFPRGTQSMSRCKIFHGWVNKKSFNFQTGKKGHVSKYSLKKRAVLHPLMRVAS